MTDQLCNLRDLIQERTGLFFRDHQGIETMADRLEPLLKKSGCSSFAEYYRFLSEGEKAAAGEWLRVITELSKPVSNFARHTKRTQPLAHIVIPQWLLNNGGTKTLKIWSAGCATGEEPLSIAMALSEAGWFDRLEVEIYASDGNSTAVEKARRGVYSESGLRYLSPALRSKYFTPVNEGWQVKPELHQRIAWSVTNLMDENGIAELAASHIIFCHNVFIYFSESAICKTLNLFGRQMPRGGYLFTDGGDYFISLMSQINIFEPREISGTSIWMKN